MATVKVTICTLDGELLDGVLVSDTGDARYDTIVLDRPLGSAALADVARTSIGIVRAREARAREKAAVKA